MMLNFKWNFSFIILTMSALLGLISCEETLFESKLSDENITVLSPTDNSKVFNKEVRFEWLKLDLASRYQIQLASPDFEKSDFMIFDRIVDTTFVIDSLRQVGKYEWRVRGLSNNQTTPFITSKIELIKNPAFEFQMVNLVSPADNKILNTLSTMVQWNAVEEAELYEVQILNSNSEVLSTQQLTERSIVLTFPEGSSAWQVRALKEDINTAFTRRTVLIDTKKPEIPRLTTPVDESTIAKADLEFAWTRTAVEGTKEKDSIYIFTDESQTMLQLKQEAVSPLKIDLEVGTYYWKIQAFDEAGNKSDESNSLSFTLN